MTPDSVKVKTLTDKATLSSFENYALKKEIKFLKKVILLFVFISFAFLIMALCVDKKYDLGKSVLDSGICVEYDMGYHCETLDNHIFIEK